MRVASRRRFAATWIGIAAVVLIATHALADDETVESVQPAVCLSHAVPESRIPPSAPQVPMPCQVQSTTLRIMLLPEVHAHLSTSDDYVSSHPPPPYRCKWLSLCCEALVLVRLATPRARRILRGHTFQRARRGKSPRRCTAQELQTSPTARAAPPPGSAAAPCTCALARPCSSNSTRSVRTGTSGSLWRPRQRTCMARSARSR